MMTRCLAVAIIKAEDVLIGVAMLEQQHEAEIATLIRNRD